MATKFKLKRFPKAPKASASAETWAAYARKKQEINTANKKVLAEKKKHEDAIKRARNIKAVKAKK